MNFNLGLGIVISIVLLGILFSSNMTTFSKDFDYQSVIKSIDVNVSNNVVQQLNESFPENKHASIFGENIVHTVSYGIGADLALGFMINKQFPELGKLLFENVWLVFVIILFVFVPGLFVLLGYVLVGALLWLFSLLKQHKKTEDNKGVFVN